MHMGELQGGSHRLQLTGEPVVPDPRESLRSLVARTCFANGLPNSFGLLRPLGLIHRNKVNIAEGSEIDSHDLAHAIKLEAKEVSSRKYAPLALDHRDFFGLQIHKSRIDGTNRRFSPAGLSEAPFHRAVWELRDLPFCLETWDMLRDRCPCPTEGTPTVQRWTRTGSRVSECDKCGHALADLPRKIVPEDLQADLAILPDLVCPVLGDPKNLIGLLPEAIVATDRSRLFDCLRQMAEIAVGGTIAGLSDDYADAILRWHAACRALLDWPNSMPGRWIKPNLEAGALAYRRERYLDLAHGGSISLVDYKLRIGSERNLHREASRAARLSPDPASLADRAAAKKARKAAAAKRRLEALRKDRKIGLRPASEAAKLDPDTLLRARDEEMLAKFERRHGSKSLPAFDRQEVTDFGARWNERIPCAKVAFDWGISVHGVEQMVAVRAMSASGPRFSHEGPHFTQGNLADFLTVLADAESSAHGEWTTLQMVMRGIDDRPKPWGAVIAGMLEKRIRFRLPKDFDHLLPSIEILEDDVELARSATFDEGAHEDVNFSPVMIQRDVCELFNVPEAKSEHISFIPSRGVVPKRFDRRTVECKRSELLSASELGRRHGMDPRSVRTVLDRAGVEPVAPSLYKRAAALNAVRGHLSNKSA